MTGTGIVSKIDELLRTNAFDTRAGLQFMGELVKDAFTFIDEQRRKNQNDTETLEGFDFRLKNMEKGLSDWMTQRSNEKREADDERKFYRRAVIGGIIAISLSELARWFLG